MNTALTVTEVEQQANFARNFAKRGPEGLPLARGAGWGGHDAPVGVRQLARRDRETINSTIIIS